MNFKLVGIWLLGLIVLGIGFAIEKDPVIITGGVLIVIGWFGFREPRN